MNNVGKFDLIIWHLDSSYKPFWLADVSYFLAKFGKERVKANKVILN